MRPIGRSYQGSHSVRKMSQRSRQGEPGAFLEAARFVALVVLASSVIAVFTISTILTLFP